MSKVINSIRPFNRKKSVRLNLNKAYAEAQNETLPDFDEIRVEALFSRKLKAIRPRPFLGNRNKNEKGGDHASYYEAWRNSKGRYRIGPEETRVVSIFVDKNNEDDKFLRAACFHGKELILCR